MGRKPSYYDFIVRVLPIVILPLMVGLLQPRSALDGAPVVIVAAFIGVAVAILVKKVHIALLTSVIIAGMMINVSHLDELRAAMAASHEHDRRHHGHSFRPWSSNAADAGHDPQPPIVPTEEATKVPGHVDSLGSNVPGSALVAAVAAGVGNKFHQDNSVAPAAGLANKVIEGNKLRGQTPKPVPLETLSVVLPCAFEGEFAAKTAEAVVQHTKRHRLLEVLVVDDGSWPPLEQGFPKSLLSGTPPVRILRHDKTLGLIATKKTGGDAAKGDVVVFFDCHIKPRDGWEDAFLKQMKRAGDHRTVVVPTITSLDPDTWEEIPNGSNGRACYILWSADFTWLTNPGRDVPLMSGGLLAISKKWWEETEGYDEHMVAWGGENIDQSLRIWLCGGRIEVAEDAFVAHMWRDPNNAKTVLRYPMPTREVMRNKARAANAWFGAFKDKTMMFPEYEQFTVNHESLGDMSNFDRLKAKQKCAPFTSYVSRFSYIYLDAGLIPPETFQVREVSTGLCLERSPHDAPPHGVVLSPCSGGVGGGEVAELQIWHAANRDVQRLGKPCCSGFMNWNFLQCMQAHAVGGLVRTSECLLTGEDPNQRFALPHDGPHAGQMAWKTSKESEVQGCVAPAETTFADAGLIPGTACSTEIEFVPKPDGGGEKQFRLYTSLSHPPGRVCGGAVGASDADNLSGLTLQFMKCDSRDTRQIFHAIAMLDGFQIRIGDSNFCLDSASGTQLLVYPCYDQKVKNKNQVWQLRGGQLIWPQYNSFCIGMKEVLYISGSNIVQVNGQYTFAGAGSFHKAADGEVWLSFVNRHWFLQNGADKGQARGWLRSVGDGPPSTETWQVENNDRWEAQSPLTVSTGKMREVLTISGAVGTFARTVNGKYASSGPGAWSKIGDDKWLTFVSGAWFVQPESEKGLARGWIKTVGGGKPEAEKWMMGNGRDWEMQENIGVTIDKELAPEQLGSLPPGQFVLRTCAAKEGQRLRRETAASEPGTFIIRDLDKNGGQQQCLGLLPGTSQSLGLVVCDEARHRWRLMQDKVQLQHVASSMCVDAGSNIDKPASLYPCHPGHAHGAQQFEVVDEPGWVRHKGSWGDNGRKREFQKCLDRSPAKEVSITVQPCASTQHRGVRWEKINPRIPIERAIWERESKPAPGSVPLGGDMAPP